MISDLRAVRLGSVRLLHSRRRAVRALLRGLHHVLQRVQRVPVRSDQGASFEIQTFETDALKILNVSIWLCRNPSRPVDRRELLAVAQYMTYLPYSMSLIVLYEVYGSLLAQNSGPLACRTSSVR